MKTAWLVLAPILLVACGKGGAEDRSGAEGGLPALGSSTHPATIAHERDLQQQAAANRLLKPVSIGRDLFGRWQRYIPATTNTKSVTYCDPANTLIVSENGAWTYNGESGEWISRGRQLSLESGGDSYEVTIHRLSDSLAVLRFDGQEPTNWAKETGTHCPGPIDAKLPDPFPIPYPIEKDVRDESADSLHFITAWSNYHQRCELNVDEYACRAEKVVLPSVLVGRYCLGRAGTDRSTWTLHRCKEGSLKVDGTPWVDPSKTG